MAILRSGQKYQACGSCGIRHKSVTAAADCKRRKDRLTRLTTVRAFYLMTDAKNPRERVNLKKLAGDVGAPYRWAVRLTADLRKISSARRKFFKEEKKRPGKEKGLEIGDLSRWNVLVMSIMIAVGCPMSLWA